MRIVQIVPRLPPALDGVGDYALNLAQQLQREFEVKTHFLVCDINSSPQIEIDSFPITCLSKQSVGELKLALLKNKDIVILHYVGYAYDQRGLPDWLINGIQKWKTDNKSGHLITMFHEIHTVDTPFWTSSFWLSPLQKKLVKKLSLMSDYCLTSMRTYAETICKISHNKHPDMPALPVFSTVGELKNSIPLTQRSLKMVVFGSCSARKQIYTSSIQQLNYACQALGIEEVIDIGQRTGLALPSLLNVQVTELGKMSSSAISEILKDSFAGFFDYFDGYLAKSTVFAAYCAHGVLPVSARLNSSSLDGIKVNQHYFLPTQSVSSSSPGLNTISTNAHSWYKNHDLKSQAKIYYSLLKKCS